jgi:Uncharacterized conserved protein
MVKYTSFKDIPRFISHGNYAVDVGIRHLQKWIDDMIKDLRLELNPDFQRGHVWTEEQQIKYVEFLLRGGKTGLDVYFNYPSWHYNVSNGAYNEFVCVDGLQRITAILAFMNNKIKVFGSYYNEYIDCPNFIRHSIRLHINDLKTRKDVLQWYLEMNSGGTPHSEAELKRVQKMYDECVEVECS